MKKTYKEFLEDRQEFYNNTPIETYNGREYKVKRIYNHRTNQIKMISYFDIDNKLLMGALIVKEYYPSGSLKRYAELYKNGNLKHVIDYSNDGIEIENIKFDSKGQPLKKNPDMIETNQETN